MQFRTRFAPSPTGPLHLGHAYSAILSHDMAKAATGTFLLRIEDIDRSRSRPEWEAQIYDDLTWLGLTWPSPVLRQSDRLPLYRGALRHLWARGLLYPCTCNRRDIAAAANAPQEGAPLHGPDGIVYPGTCRHIPDSTQPLPDTALRLNTARALEILTHRPFARPLQFTETGTGQPETHVIDPADFLQNVGDIVLARRDMGTSYHLSVVLDDAAQHITHVTRGADLFAATQIHVLLQQLLHLPTPLYHHHRLIRDDQGKRLAKRDDARAIATYRAEGATPHDIRHLIGLD
ncbi:tRNA glutamyl-Q(34) synthetase GluQRS [Thalassovita sp.]|uniref:tRNA glutamyl-Q(34) synthetase GluQRS n=1 Tax=Thalassovita sp. TaxID=1979401 RepID=UPI0029DE6550|nr:tRNA glutamyl-Q(34) synthetase GluQRS [Thalassovita sp.]